MAIYDVTDMAEMLKSPYVDLRQSPIQSQRERDTMKEIFVDRRFYDLVHSDQSSDFKLLENIENEGVGNVMITVSVFLEDGTEKAFEEWYQKIDLPALKKLDGWTRSRYFKTATVDDRDAQEIYLIHEFKPTSEVAAKEKFLAQTSHLWDDLKGSVRSKTVRSLGLWYTFGPAPRELKALEHPEYDVDYELTDKITRSFSARSSSAASPYGGGAVESYVTTKDGAKLQYRLEGNSSPTAPLIVLANSILVDWHIYDDFLAAFFSNPSNKKYRVIRYFTRGRTSYSLGTSETPITVDLLASDIITILDALRVPKAAAVMGVSLGGATALNVGLKHSNRVEKFISCDTSAKSPAGNSKAWSERIAIAEKEGMKASSGEAIVGGELAEVTTKRWFVPESYDGAELEKKCWLVNEMVKNNSLEGFKRSVRALWEYDMMADVERVSSAGQGKKGMFLVGGKDGVLPKSMETLSGQLSGSRFVCIEGAGHLPMVEKPNEVADAVTEFLGA